MSNPQSKIADIAESQLGTKEDAAHTNRGAAILKYQQATDLAGQGWPWCAAFVDWCVAQAQPGFLRVKDLPRTAAAFGLIDWGKAHGCLVFSPSAKNPPQRGDLVVYNFSHCGIVADFVAPNLIHAVEGNTNDGGSRDGYTVARKLRTFASIKTIIRIPVIAQPV